MAKIKVENIVKTFNRHSRNANKVLKGVSFELPEKGLVCIFGKSGSGKTTMLNIIGGLEKQDSGKIYIDGECTTGKADKIRNEKIGFIFQNYYLEKGYTIAEILRNAMILAGFKDEEEMKRRAEEALKLVDMERFKNKRGDALSGGQQQRVAIARAIVKGGDIILADEPTGNLDAENTFKVMDILKEISKTHLVVVVTHEVTLIKKYADSHIKLVDGELVPEGEIDEAELASITYDNIAVQDTNADLTVFTKSTAKRNGRLFNFKNIFKSIRSGSEEKAYSTGNIFKQIFILAMAVVMCFFALALNEALSATADSKPLGENTVYTNLNAYSVLRSTDEDSYSTIDFFDTHRREGSFSYGGISSLSGISVTYSPKAIDLGEEVKTEYGTAPQSGEVLVSRALAEELKRQFRLESLQTDKAVTLTEFDGEYKISGIVSGDDRVVYLNKVDYVNFLGVYDKIKFADSEKLFFKDSYGSVSFTAEILLYDGTIDSDKVRVEINRNSLYKMMADSTQADYEINKTNSQLKRTPYAIQVDGSKVYVEQFSVTRDIMTTDIRIYVSEETLSNIFVYISPNMDALSSTGSDYYFAVTANSGAELTTLKADLRSNGVTAVNVSAVYERENAEAKEEAQSGLYLYYIIIALLFAIYFFIEKSGSIKNSKEYGIYRAIGVNKSNLLFKETMNAVFSNTITYLLFFLVACVILCVRYAVMNTVFTTFIWLSLALFAASAVLMVGVSLIPYLFVLYKSPSQILASYDI